ncbi:hypothetical protein MYX65_00390 [Acidobacteria bacterium AH-259-L09]|nr:hypothetical protein [Acidobacteria bacterium AH-259-L09]
MLFYTFLPDHEFILSFEPEELAGYVLEFLNDDRTEEGLHNRYNFTLDSNLAEYPQEVREDVAKALTEAWMWLLRDGLIAPQPGDTSGDWVFVTRRGRQFTGHVDVESYRKKKCTPQGSTSSCDRRKMLVGFHQR